MNKKHHCSYRENHVSAFPSQCRRGAYRLGQKVASTSNKFIDSVTVLVAVTQAKPQASTLILTVALQERYPDCIYRVFRLIHNSLVPTWRHSKKSEAMDCSKIPKSVGETSTLFHSSTLHFSSKVGIRMYNGGSTYLLPQIST
jgi:hypothetical protein